MAASVADVYALIDGIPVGAWAAIEIHEPKLLAFGMDHRAVLTEAQEKGEMHPLMLRKLDPHIALAL